MLPSILRHRQNTACSKKIAQSHNVNNAKLGKALAEAWKLRWLEREKEKKRRQTMSTYWGIRVALHTSLRNKLIAWVLAVMKD